MAEHQIDRRAELDAPAGCDRRNAVAFLLTGVGCSAVVAVVLFLSVFGEFGFGDDDGYVMLSVRVYLQGAALYRELYTQYGPLFFQWHAVLHRLLGISLDHDSTRLLTVAASVLISFLGALAVWVRTRSIAAAAVTQLGAGAVLIGFREGPGHPQELVMLFSTAALLGVAASASLVRQAMITGICTAALLLIKVNAGVFLGIGVVYAALALTPLLSQLCGRSRPPSATGWTRLLGLLIALGLLVLPAALMQGLIGHGQVFRFIILEMFALLFLLVRFAYTATIGCSIVTAGVTYGVSVGFVLAVLLLLTVGEGVTPGELVRGVLLDPAKFPGQFFKLFWIRNGDLFLPLAASGVLLGVSRGGRERRELVEWVRLGAAAAFFGSLPLLVADSINFTQNFIRPVLCTAAAFAWVLVPFDAAEESPAKRFASRFLGLYPVIFLLYVYPVAGTQLSLALLPFVVLCGVVLGERGGAFRRTLASARRAVCMLGAAAGAPLSVYLISHLHSAYRTAVPLDLPGAQLLRSPERDVAVYRFLVANLSAHVRSFYSLPGLNSLYFWTAIEPPNAMNSTNWMALWSDAQQQEVRAALEREEDRGAVWNDYITRFWMSGPIRSGPLTAALNALPAAASVRRYELRMRELPRLEELRYFATVLPGETLYRRFPDSSGERFVAVEYGAWITGRIVETEVARIGEKGAEPPAPVKARVLADQLRAGGGRWALLAAPASIPWLDDSSDPSTQESGESMVVVRLFTGGAGPPVSIPVARMVAPALDEQRQSLAGALLAPLVARSGLPGTPAEGNAAP